jgi:cellobiose epimerase
MNRMIVHSILAMLLIAPCCTVTGGKKATPAPPPVTDGDSIAVQMERTLDVELSRWYPLCVDTLDGGYYSDISDKWEIDGRQQKMIVTQARHIWSIANAAMFNRSYRRLLPFAAHGYRFLRHKMWDPEFGGFYNLVDRHGDPVTENGRYVKTAYGNAFAIYGLSTFYKASGDTGALSLALEAYRWLEKHSYDTLYHGYFQFLSRDGIPFAEGFNKVPPKDQNSMIHLMEAYTALYDVWPDSVLATRLESMIRIVRDTITNDLGYMNLFFERNWKPVTLKEVNAPKRLFNYELDHISFGHDVETAYLLLDASQALGLRDDTTTLSIAKKKVDFALRHGWDTEHGGLFDGGDPMIMDGRVAIMRETKEWWSQAEALNSFLMMSMLFPRDPLKYYARFTAQWDYCREYVIDGERGGWYWGGIDKAPGNKNAPKGTIWKADYHTSRAMINCIQRLRNMSSRRRPYDPVNPDATPAAKKLLADLQSIAGKKIISGHQNSVNRPDLFPNRIKELTGKLPEIWGCDLAGYFRKGYSDDLVRLANEKYKSGYIVTLMWHTGRPQDDPPFGWKESVQAKMTDDEWRSLITPGSPLNIRWQNRIDTIASCLKKLQALGIPVLWRPFHEQNGVWFWWGNRKGPDGSARLYRMMYDRFVTVHHLDNLVWVWDTNTPRRLVNDEAWDYDDFFPGLDCVDVLAADVYHNDFKQSHHDELLELAGGKVIALGEVGEVPSPTVLSLQPLWTWFMIWSDFVDTHNTPAQIRRLYDDPRTLSHGDRIGDR